MKRMPLHWPAIPAGMVGTVPLKDDGCVEGGEPWHLARGASILYHWSKKPTEISKWIEAALERRDSAIPNNDYPAFKNNWSGKEWQPYGRKKK